MVKPINSSHSSSDLETSIRQSEEKEIKERSAEKPQKSENQETVEILFFQSLAETHELGQFYTLNESHKITFSTDYDKIYTKEASVGEHILYNPNHNLQAVVEKTKAYVCSKDFQWAIVNNPDLQNTLNKALVNLNKDIEEWNRSAGYLNFFKNTLRAFFSKLQVIIGSLFDVVPKRQVKWLERKRNHIQPITLDTIVYGKFKTTANVINSRENLERYQRLLNTFPSSPIIRDGVFHQFEIDVTRDITFSIKEANKPRRKPIKSHKFSKKEKEKLSEHDQALIQKNLVENALKENNKEWSIPLQDMLSQTMGNTLWLPLLNNSGLGLTSAGKSPPIEVEIYRDSSEKITSIIISLQDFRKPQFLSNEVITFPAIFKGSLQIELTLDKENKPQIKILKREYTIDNEIFTSKEEATTLPNPKLSVQQKLITERIKKTVRIIPEKCSLKETTELLEKPLKQISKEKNSTRIAGIFKLDISRSTFFSINEKDKDTIHSIKKEMIHEESESLKNEVLINRNIELIEEALGKENHEWSLPLQTMFSQRFMNRLWDPLQLFERINDNGIENGILDINSIKQLINATILRDETEKITSIIFSHTGKIPFTTGFDKTVLIDNAVEGILEAELTLDEDNNPHIKILKREYIVDGEKFTEEAS